jgi:hypothetical protein
VTLNRNDDEVVEVVEVVEVDEVDGDLDTDATTADATADDASTEEFRSDSEAPRAAPGPTLGELGDRLDPANVMEKAKENVREATIGRVEHAVEEAGTTAKGTADMVMQTIKENPIPAAMAGAGLFLLWRNRNQGGSGSSFRGSSYRYGDQRYAYGDRGYGYGNQSYGGYYGDRGYYGYDRTGPVEGAANVVGGALNAAGNIAGAAVNTAGNIAQSVLPPYGDRYEYYGNTYGYGSSYQPGWGYNRGYGYGQSYYGR